MILLMKDGKKINVSAMFTQGVRFKVQLDKSNFLDCQSQKECLL